MSDAPPPADAGRAPDGRPPGPLTPAAIDAVLADFRVWLSELAQLPPPPSSAPEPAAPVDLFTLVGQFTALRHEVNMQTKASRAAVEANADALRRLEERAAPPPPPAPPSDDELRPLLKAVLDVADALAVSLAQVEKLHAGVEPLLADLERDPSDVGRTPFLARLFGGERRVAELQEHDRRQSDRAREAGGKLRQLVKAAADGYAMSVRRVDRAAAAVGLERIAAVGHTFDPDAMEVVEAAAADGVAPGTVVGEVRAGYRWRGRVFRYAQVRVAR